MNKSGVKFYFDFISPYAWLAWRPLLQIVQKHQVEFEAVPVLFAGLLNHHGQLGPAEIPSKRNWIVQDVARRAQLNNLTFNVPPSHPFNPLLPLRLASLPSEQFSKDSQLNLIGKILDATWSEGKDVSDPAVLKGILNSIGMDGDRCLQQTNSPTVKDKLKNETQKAIEAGVFGVPTTIVNGSLLFWGSEYETMKMIEMAIVGDSRVIVEPALLEKWANLKKTAERRKEK